MPVEPPPAPLRIWVVFVSTLGMIVGLAWLALSEMQRATQALRDEVEERRSAEAQRRESEARARSFIESSPMGIHLYRLEADDRLVLTGPTPPPIGSWGSTIAHSSARR